MTILLRYGGKYRARTYLGVAAVGSGLLRIGRRGAPQRSSSREHLTQRARSLVYGRSSVAGFTDATADVPDQRFAAVLAVLAVPRTAGRLRTIVRLDGHPDGCLQRTMACVGFFPLDTLTLFHRLDLCRHLGIRSLLVPPQPVELCDEMVYRRRHDRMFYEKEERRGGVLSRPSLYAIASQLGTRSESFVVSGDMFELSGDIEGGV